MICITVTPKSRKLAKVDLLNASRQGDIIELCVDHLAKEPDFADLVGDVNKPMIISCRREQDGGHWTGSEENRLLLLRKAIVAKPAYVELDLDIAKQIPRFGEVQRVISFTRLDRPETDIEEMFDEATDANADVVKFAWPTPTLDDAWPLLAAVSKKRRLPIVGMGFGRPELTFSLLGLKYGSPWIYAALEPGMEAHDGQATVFELDEVYHWQEITKSTNFIAVAGFGPAQEATTRVLNAAFAELEMKVRCLPIELGELKRLSKMLDTLKVKAIIVTGPAGKELVNLAEHIDPEDLKTQYIDLLLKKSDGWRGYNSIWRSGVKSLEAELGKSDTGERPLEKQNVLVLGSGGIAQSMVAGIAARKGIVSICGQDDKRAKHIAELMDCRFVPRHNMYDTLSDVTVIADADLTSGQKQGDVNPSYFRSGMTVIDVSQPPIEHELLTEARERGCKTIGADVVFAHQIGQQFKALTSKELPASALATIE